MLDVLKLVIEDPLRFTAEIEKAKLYTWDFKQVLCLTALTLILVPALMSSLEKNLLSEV